MNRLLMNLCKCPVQATMSKKCAGLPRLLAAAMMIFVGSPVAAQNIIDEWATVKAASPPALKAVTVDNKTALLLLDFGK